jgi:prephenate dehydratase
MSILKKIAFQGEPGANSHEACRTYFPDYEAYPCATFEEAFEAIKSGAAQLGMIPIENSIAGRVADVHHLLPASGLKIIGERFKPIRFQLMANKGVTLDQVKTAVSMAGAAKALALKPDPTRAAVAPALAAEIYGLDILARDIEDERHNTTRFLVMTADPAPPAPSFTHRCVTSFVFRVRNLPAALFKAMGGFATNGVNMTKLESYMENGAFTATFFYAEVDGRPEDRNLALAFDELKFFSERFEILGVYPADPFRDRG